MKFIQLIPDYLEIQVIRFGVADEESECLFINGIAGAHPRTRLLAAVADNDHDVRIRFGRRFHALRQYKHFRNN